MPGLPACPVRGGGGGSCTCTCPSGGGSPIAPAKSATLDVIASPCVEGCRFPATDADERRSDEPVQAEDRCEKTEGAYDEGVEGEHASVTVAAVETEALAGIISPCATKPLTEVEGESHGERASSGEEPRSASDAEDRARLEVGGCGGEVSSNRETEAADSRPRLTGR